MKKNFNHKGHEVHKGKLLALKALKLRDLYALRGKKN